MTENMRDRTARIVQEKRDEMIARMAAAKNLPGLSVMTPYAFLRRFTQDERIAIRTAAKQVAVIEDWMYLLDHATEIDLADANLVAGMGGLVAGGLLTGTRRDQILGA